MNVLTDLGGAEVVLTDDAEDFLDVSGVVFGDLGSGVVHDQFTAEQLCSFDCGWFDLVAGGAALECDECFELVAPVRGCGETDPAAGPRRPHACRKRHSWEVVALIDDDQAVGVEERRVISSRQALDHRHVDDAGGHVATAAELADCRWFGAEVVAQACLPLIEEFLAIYHDERWLVVVGDHSAGHHCLA